MAAAVPLVFGAIGAWAAPAGYAAMGFSIGSAIGSMLVPGPNTQGPRMGDLSVQASTYGMAVPKVYGTCRVAGNLIWTSGIVEHATEDGGKGGPTYTSYSYSASWAVALAEGAIAGVRRIWFDSDLVYDASESASAATLAASLAFLDKVTIYTGTESQTADPLIEASEGAGNVPAYRGVAYLVFDDLNIDKYGRIPNVSVEIGTGGTVAADLTCLTNYYGTAFVNDNNWEVACIRVDSNRQTMIVGYYDRDPAPNFYSYIKTRTYAINDDDTLTLQSTFTGSTSDHQIYYNHYYQWSFSNLSDDVIHFYQHYSAPGNMRLMLVGGAFEDYVISGFPYILGDTNYRLDGGGVAISNTHVAIGTSSSAGRVIKVYERGGALLRSVDVAAYISGNINHLSLTLDGLHVIFAQTTTAYSIEIATGTVSTVVTLGSFEGSTPNVPGDAVFYTRTTGRWHYASAIRDFDFTTGWSTTNASTANYGAMTNPLAGYEGIHHNGSLFFFYTRDSNNSGNCCYIGTYLSANPATLAMVDEVVEDILGTVTAATADTAQLDGDTVQGYAIGRQTSARAALKPLQDAYLFDIVEAGGELVCVKRGGASAASIPEDDLAAAEPGQAGEAFSLRRGQDAELPRKLNVLYYDFARDHQANVQSASRLATEAVSIADMDIPIVTDADHMAQVAEVLLYNAWRARETVTFAIPAETYYALDPADIVTVTYGGDSHRLRLTKIDYSAPGLMRCEAAFDDAEIYASTATGVAGTVATQTVTGLGTSVGLWLDTPLLIDSHDPAGVYAALGSDGTKWQGGALLLSVDGGVEYVTVATFPVQCIVGATSTTLASGTVDRFDRANTVRVVLANSAHELSSITEAQALDGGNACVIGNEILSFATATLVTAGTYDLSVLIRGRRGTEWAVGTHTSTDGFALLNESVRRVTVPNAKIGATVHYKFVQTGEIAGDIAGTSVTYEARAYEPYSVCHLTATDAGGGDWDIAWTRRNRLDGEWRDYVDVPMSEATEAYRVEVYTGSTLDSSADVTTATATVAASSGDTVKVYQLSATTGPGFVSTVSIP